VNVPQKYKLITPGFLIPLYTTGITTPYKQPRLAGISAPLKYHPLLALLEDPSPEAQRRITLCISSEKG